MKAVLCPICCGAGKIPQPDGIYTAPTKVICHGCDGKGWVEVREEPDYNPEYYTGSGYKFYGVHK